MMQYTVQYSYPLLKSLADILHIPVGEVWIGKIAVPCTLLVSRAARIVRSNHETV